MANQNPSLGAAEPRASGPSPAEDEDDVDGYVVAERGHRLCDERPSELGKRYVMRPITGEIAIREAILDPTILVVVEAGVTGGWVVRNASGPFAAYDGWIFASVADLVRMLDASNQAQPRPPRPAPPPRHSGPDQEAGLYSKYRVERTDGSSAPGGKHQDCSYFVLDWEHDPFAVPAMKAYADACEKTYPWLARDLRVLCEHYDARHRLRALGDRYEGRPSQ